MTKSILQKSYIVLTILLLVITMLACASDDKDNNTGDNGNGGGDSTAPSTTVNISGGNTVIVPNGTTSTFVASLSGDDNGDVVWSWSVNPTSAGTFGNSGSDSTTFTAGSQELIATIKATASLGNHDYSETVGISIESNTIPPQDYPEYQVTPDVWTPNPDTYPGAAKERLQKYLSRQDYEELFPNRYGNGEWYPSRPELQPKFDYYSYDNLLSAIEKIANIVVISRARDDNGNPSTWNTQTIVLHKNNGTTGYIVNQASDFDADWNLSKPIHTQVADFGEFLNHKLDNDNKREIATMLAHMTQETSGGGGGADPVADRIAKALWYIEEMGYEGSTSPNYVDSTNTNYPPTPGKSYHGRGPKQLSWNYNYGLFSDIFYLDKRILLDNPELIVQDGKLGFMTAIAFYMTPQPPKASMHQVIDSRFEFSNPADAARFVPGFGLTIIIINGGYEAGLTEADPRVATRVGAYRNICARNGANIEGEKLDTAGMGTW